MKKQKALAGLLALTLISQGVPLNVLAEDINDTKVSITQNLKESPSDIIAIPDAVLKSEIIQQLKLYNDITVTDGKITREMAEQLTELNLEDGKEISNLKGIEAFKNLEEIRIRRANIADLSPLSNLTKLEMLRLKDNEISDVSALTGLKSLNYLDLKYNKLTDEDIVNLAKIGTLTKLYLNNDDKYYTPKKADRANKISDLSPLAKLKLIDVKVGGNAISDISPLKDTIMNSRFGSKVHDNQKVVKNIEIKAADTRAGNSVEIEHGIVGFNENIKINNMEIKDAGLADKITASYENGKIKLTFKEALPEDVKSIKIGYSFSSVIFGFPMTSFAGDVDMNIKVKEETVNIPDKNLENKLIELLSYKGVKVTSGNITKSMLEKFDGSLNLVNLGIENPEGLQYTKVKYLELSENKLDNADLAVIKEIKTLETLDLHDNDISDVTGLASLTGLKKLELANNKIEDISALVSLINIEDLDLNNNNISDINALSKLTKLKYVKLDGNAISDITPIKDRILNETIKSKYHEKQTIEVEKTVKSTDKTFDISNDIKGFDDDITITVTNGTYKDGKITVTDLEKPVSYTFKDEHAVGAWSKARFSGTVNVNLTVEPGEVIPKSFTVKFVQPNGKTVKETVLRGYTGIFAPRLVMPNGEMAVWKADCVDLVLNDGDYVSAQTLDLDFTWTEENPTVIFKPVVMPKSFTVKFVNNGKVIKEEVLRGYRGVEIPRLVMPNGEMAKWKADCVDLTVTQGDFVSAQTLDLDYLWTEENPTIIFNIAE